MASGYLRIGEFSQRVGVSAERLRAWEKRYALLSPERSEGGFRLYSNDDVARVRRMLHHLEGGASAAEAARLAQQEAASLAGATTVQRPAGLDEWVRQLRERLEEFDDPGAHAVLDDLLATFSLETALRDVVLPCLADLGSRWATGEVSVAQEHFASNLLRGRLLSLAQGWGQGPGPRAVLATPPRELHDLGLLACGLALARQGVRIVFLGADCPIETLADTVETVRPAMVLLSAADATHVRAVQEPLRALSASIPVYLGGHGVDAQLADELGATEVGADPISAAARLARSATAVAGGLSDG